MRIAPGRERLDRHGRELANLYDRSGQNLSEQLLRLGLAYPITVPPNDRFQRCYAAAAADAKTHGRGLWSLPPVEAAALRPDAEGFMRLVGRVQEVRFGRRSIWIDLAGPLKLRVAAEDRGRFDPASLSALIGARVEVLGWVYQYRGEPRIRLRDPSALRRVTRDGKYSSTTFGFPIQPAIRDNPSGLGEEGPSASSGAASALLAGLS